MSAPNKDYIRGLNAALRVVRSKPRLKTAKAINEFADMAGMDSADVFHDACVEMQHDIDQRICRLILKEADKAAAKPKEAQS